MNPLKALPAVLILGLLAACSTVSVSSDYTPETDFAAFKTYKWYHTKLRDPESLQYLGGDIFDQRVRHAINTVLQSKGFVLVEDGPADFKVNYDVLTEDRQDIRTYNTYGGYAPGWGYYPYGYGGVGTTTTQVVDYKQGQLIIDVLEPEKNLLVWRGTADGRIPKKNESPQKREEATFNIVAKILANFPPQPGKK